MGLQAIGDGELKVLRDAVWLPVAEEFDPEEPEGGEE